MGHYPMTIGGHYENINLSPNGYPTKDTQPSTYVALDGTTGEILGETRCALRCKIR